MAFMLIRNRVKDFAKWKPVFDEFGATRKKAGSKGARLFRSARDPNELVILLEWDDLNQARAYSELPEWRQARERAGVTETPDVYFLEEIDRQPA